MKLHVADDIGMLATLIADYLRPILDSSVGQRVTVGLSGGSMPAILLPAFKMIDLGLLSNITFFFCDERLVAFDDKDSNWMAYKDCLVAELGLKEANFVLIDPDLSVEKCADDYETKLRALFATDDCFPKFDILLLGLGPDGHTCSLFPSHPALQIKDRLVVAITDSPKPPPQRVTLSMPAVIAAQRIAFIATGDNKADIIQEIYAKRYRVPAALIEKVKEADWFLDSAAAKKII